MYDFTPMQQATINGEEARVVELVAEALKQQVKPEDIVATGLQTAMITVGEKFSSGEFFIPDMLYAARATSKALEILQPLLAQSVASTIGKVVIGTVAGDIHDIGKNLVSMFLKGAGFEVVDLGINLPAENFVSAVKEQHPDILGLSALLTTTMPAMQTTLKALEDGGMRQQVKVVIGGAPVTQRFADQIGADGYAADGGSAIQVCRKLIGK